MQKTTKTYNIKQPNLVAFLFILSAKILSPYLKNSQIILFFLLPTLLVAQHTYTGVIKDASSNKPLPFASITTNLGTRALADADGKFQINATKTIETLSISYIGYATKVLVLDTQKKFYTILLAPKAEALQEVVIKAKENPALAIIKKTIGRKKSNDIEKALSSFEYRSYNKFVIGASPDSIQANIDSVFVIKQGEKVFDRLDSSNYYFKKRIDKGHLYLTEKISEHKFQRGKNKKELILASRMAGFQEPIYEVLALDIENFSFYDEVYTLLGNKYINPLAQNAPKYYRYQILDTLSKRGQNTYLIYFKPKRTGLRVGLEGVLYINDQQFALEKGIAQLKGVVNVKAVQHFNYQAAQSIWFPVETEISIRKGQNKAPIKLFGGITFSASKVADSVSRSSKNDPSDITYLSSKTKNFDIQLNQPVRLRNSASSIEVDTAIDQRDTTYWNGLRTEPISSRDLATYRYIDSISVEEGAERKLKAARKILKGYYPTTYFDIDLSQLINFNNYEGFRLGFGGLTTNRFSRAFRIQGYSAYGFKDSKFKYHAAAQIRLHPKNNTWIGLSYTNDLQEAAKIDFLFDETSFSLINPRNLNISQFYAYKKYALNFEHDIFPNLESKITLSTEKVDTKFNYQFFNAGTLFNDFNLSMATFAIKWTPFSTYMEAPIGKIAVRNGYPKITAQVAKSFDNILDGSIDFTQFQLKIEQNLQFRNNSSLVFLMQGAVVGGNAPLTHLYNATPNYTLRNPWRKRINFSGTNAFETMTFNEFISERYVSLQGRYNFRRFQISNRFKPQLSLISRFALGTIDEPENHIGVEFQKMNKGYLESGFVLNHLFKGFGVSSFYRYGAYRNAVFSDNLAVKLTYVLSLGF